MSAHVLVYWYIDCFCYSRAPAHIGDDISTNSTEEKRYKCSDSSFSTLHLMEMIVILYTFIHHYSKLYNDKS